MIYLSISFVFLGLLFRQNYQAKLQILEMKLRVEQIKNAHLPLFQNNIDKFLFEEKLFILEQQAGYLKLLLAETRSN